MKHSLTYLFFLPVLFIQLSAQERQLSLVNGNSQLFRGNIYCYGFLSKTQKTSFCIYKMNAQLKTLDSLVIEQETNKPDGYLRISSDTLHDFLNIYIQKKEKKLVTVLRFNKNFELIATIDNIDIARLNSISAFENDLLYAGRCVYTVKSQKDSTGYQFYLNKFSLKSELKNFDYEFSWQFAFERQNIHSAHVFYADRQVVLLYVTINGGVKAGQWILSLQASSGKLIRGTKLNNNRETGTYEFGNFGMDSVKRVLTLAGQKFTEAQFRPLENVLSISNAPFVTLYLAEIDSGGEIGNKQEFKIPVTEAKTNSKKTISNYLLRINSLNKNNDGKISLEGDIFKNSDNSLCYQYSNTIRLNLLPSDDQLLLERNSVASNPLIEKFYFSPDKEDRNGKIKTDSLTRFETLFYTPLNFPVKLGFKTDTDNNPVWLLKKSLPKKNTINYTLLSPVKKAYLLTTIEEITTFNNPTCLVTGSSFFIIAQQLNDETYRLKLYSW